MPTESVIEVALPANQIFFNRLCLILAISVIGLLFYLGAKPMAVGLFPSPWDKLAHLVAFGAITVLLWFGLGQRQPWLLIGLVSAIGAIDELHQASLPGRSVDFTDFLTDVGAAMLAVIVLQRCRK